MSIYSRLLPSICGCCICIFRALPIALSAGQVGYCFSHIRVNLQSLLQIVYKWHLRGASGACQSHYQHAVISFCISLGSTTHKDRIERERERERKTGTATERPQSASLWLLLLHFELAICFDFCSLITFLYASICSCCRCYCSCCCCCCC